MFLGNHELDFSQVIYPVSVDKPADDRLVYDSLDILLFAILLLLLNAIGNTLIHTNVFQVFKPIVEKFGVHFDCDLRMRFVSLPMLGELLVG